MAVLTQRLCSLGQQLSWGQERALGTHSEVTRPVHTDWRVVKSRVGFVSSSSAYRPTQKGTNNFEFSPESILQRKIDQQVEVLLKEEFLDSAYGP